MPNFCESCGSPLEEDALFCSICGAKVELDEPEPLAPEPAVSVHEPTVEAPEPVEVPAPVEIPAPVEAEPLTAPPVQALSAEPNEGVAQPEGKSKAPLFAVLGAAVVLVLAFAIWQLAGAKPSPKQPTKDSTGVAAPSSNTEAKVNKPSAPSEKHAEASEDTILILRTEVTKSLADVSAAGWSDASSNKAISSISSLSKKVEGLGRTDLADYWRSLSFYIQACNAGSHRDRAKAKAFFEKAAGALVHIPLEKLSADPTLKGDAIGTIGAYFSLANDIGLPDDYPPVKGLRQLKRKLEQ